MLSAMRPRVESLVFPGTKARVSSRARQSADIDPLNGSLHRATRPARLPDLKPMPGNPKGNLPLG